MGLNISHDAFSASYSRFGRFRQAIAEALGLKCAFVDVRPVPTDQDGWLAHQEELPIWKYSYAVYGVDIFGGELGEKHPWYEMDISVEMKTFLDHSDCNGIIFNEMLKKLSNELQLLVELIDDEFKNDLIQLIKGFRLAHSKGEDIIFY